MAHPQLKTPTTPAAAERTTRPRARSVLAGGTAGNELLTAGTGVVLIALLAVLGLTILKIGSLLWVHLFVGLVLLGPLALKLASTGYRFVRYYTHDPVYVEEGPPEPALRMIAPVVVASTLVVFVSGVVLLAAGPEARPTWFPIHKVSFFVWVAFMSVHVLGHLPAVARGLHSDYGSDIDRLHHGAPGRSARALSIASALTLGLVLALVLIPQFGPWIHAQQFLHHH